MEAAQRIIETSGEKRPKLVAVSASALLHEQQQYLSAGFDHFIAKPVIAEELYQSLADLLHVEYVYTSARENQDIGRITYPSDRLDFSDVALPADLLDRLKEAAQFGELTHLENHLNAIREHGEGATRLADRLLELVRAVEISEILETLEKVRQT